MKNQNGTIITKKRLFLCKTLSRLSFVDKIICDDLWLIL